MQAIVEAHEGDPSYLERRSKEMISEAQMCLGLGSEPNDLQYQQYHDKMAKAIMLLSLARATRRLQQEKVRKPQP